MTLSVAKDCLERRIRCNYLRRTCKSRSWIGRYELTRLT
jgi:hypothetical protein